MIQRGRHNTQIQRSSKHEPNTQWDESRIQQAFMLALLGHSDAMIAEAMQVHPRTLDYWKRTNPRFNEMLQRGKTEADMLVVNEWYKICFDRWVEWEEDVVSKGVKITLKKKMFVPANPKAIFRWMMLRQRGMWSEDPTKAIQFNQTNIKIDHLDLSSLNDNELKTLMKFGLLQISQGESNTNYSDNDNTSDGN